MATRPTAARPIKALAPCAVAAELEVVAGAEVLEEADEVGEVPVLEAVAPVLAPVLEAVPPVLEAVPLVLEAVVLEVAPTAGLPVLDEVPLAVTAPLVLEAVAERVKETPTDLHVS